MNIIGFIPARMGSTRFPGKPLAKICGLSMIEHVYRRSRMSKRLNDLYVATCDPEIREATEHFGGKVIMTKTTHQRASDRVAEAMLKVEKQTKKKADIIVMIQGDEPMVYPRMIDEAVQPLLLEKDIHVSNLMAPLSKEEARDVNEIKVVVDKKGRALYFSRQRIPSHHHSAEKTTWLKQVCIIPFKRDFLIRYTKLKQTPLEKSESVDMLRILENGFPVRMVLTKFQTHSVDTPEGLERVEKIMQKDLVFEKYKRKQLDEGKRNR